MRLDQDAAGGQVGAGDKFDQLIESCLGALDQVQQRIAQFAHVVGRDAGRHADGDAAGTVGQQVGKTGRQELGLRLLAIVCDAEIHRVLVNALQQGLGDFGQAGLSVAHGRRPVAVHVAEVALPFDQGIARRELLRQAHQRVVDCGIAVGVVLANDVADDASAFLEPGLGIQLQLAHGVEEPPVDRLETVAYVGQRARHDGRQGIGKVALAEGIGQRGLANLTGRGGFAHRSPRVKLSCLLPDIVAIPDI